MKTYIMIFFPFISKHLFVILYSQEPVHLARVGWSLLHFTRAPTGPFDVPVTSLWIKFLSIFLCDNCATCHVLGFTDLSMLSNIFIAIGLCLMVILLTLLVSCEIRICSLCTCSNAIPIMVVTKKKKKTTLDVGF